MKSMSPIISVPRTILQTSLLSGQPVILIACGSGPVTPRIQGRILADATAMNAKTTSAVLYIFSKESNDLVKKK